MWTDGKVPVKGGVRMCPLCRAYPELYQTSRGCWYECDGCGDKATSADTVEGAKENWNAGITPEYVMEVYEEE